MKNKISTQEIRSFYREQISSLKRTVSMSRKGKPRKQSWGMHIINPYKGRHK